MSPRRESLHDRRGFQGTFFFFFSAGPSLSNAPIRKFAGEQLP